MKAVIISGATSSGKSSLALDFAQFYDISIINADALQIFSGLEILSAQPTNQEQEDVEHKLYSILQYDDKISVALWLNMVAEEIKLSFSRNKIPVIVGGSGMYISKLLDGISQIPDVSSEIKIEAKKLYESLEKEKFIAYLLDLGEKYENIKNLDKYRLIRCYEVLKQTKKTIKYWQNLSKRYVIDPEIFIHINLNIDRNQLYKNCNLRFNQMLNNGAIDEVKNLLKKDINDDLQITKTLGFYEIRDYLQNKIDEEKMIEISAKKTRNYAKRQLTWFRNQFDHIKYFSDKNNALEFLKNNL